MTMMLIKTLRKRSKYFNIFYDTTKTTENYVDLQKILPPKHDHNQLLINLLINDINRITLHTDKLNDIIFLIEYYGLTNVILVLNLTSINDYNSLYDNINKDITVTNNFIKIINIPSNTNIFKCKCKKVINFTGYAKTMIFNATKLSGIVDIPEKCTECFSCTSCRQVTGFTGWAKKMNFGSTNISGIIDIPEKCTDKISCRGTKVTGFTGWAKTMIFNNTKLSGVIDIPEKCINCFGCYYCKQVTGFTGGSKVMLFNNTNLSGVIDVPEKCTEYFLHHNCTNITKFTGNTRVLIK